MQFAHLTITEYISPSEVKATLQAPTVTIPVNYRWSLGAFGDDEGYPSVGVIHDNMLIVSGSLSSPGEVWFSALGDFSNWAVGGYTGSSFSVVLGNDKRNSVRWMKAKEYLLIGTDSSEFSINPRDRDLTLSLQNYYVRKQSEYGSEAIPAVAMGNVIAFVEAGSYRLRILENSEYDRGYFDSTDISFKVSDYFENDKVIQTTYARSPIPTLWVLTENRKLYTWTFDKTNGVSSWAEQLLPGEVFSIAAASSEIGDVITVGIGTDESTGIYAIQPGNECLDLFKEFVSVDQNTLYNFPSLYRSNVKAYDSSGADLEINIYQYLFNYSSPVSIGSMIRMITSEEFDELWLDDELAVEGKDYVHLEGSNTRFYVISKAFTSHEVQVAGIVLQPGVDYDFRTNCDWRIISLTPDAGITWDNIEVNNGTLSPLLDYLVQNNDTAIIITDVALELRETGWTPRVLEEGYDYIVQEMLSGFTIPKISSERAGVIWVGAEVENLVHPLDPMANFQLGGPGGTLSISELRLVLKNTVGLQVREYDEFDKVEKPWISIPDVTPDGNVGVLQPIFTGVKQIDFSGDTQYNGVDLQFRGNGFRPATICSMSVNVERSK